MRLFKLITAILLLIFTGIFTWQNIPSFNTLVPFHLDLYFLDVIHWEHKAYTLLALAAVPGFILGILVMVRPYLKLRKTLHQERETRAQAAAGQAASEPPPSREIPAEILTGTPESDKKDADTRPQ